ncbi:MAG TPA: hypothetical protein DCS55_04595 [Acidimicrobiaceae bacterium]|nr:hypothetical protein [Acidimicrobiaceae bacterium]
MVANPRDVGVGPSLEVVAEVPESEYAPSALPSTGARILAFVAILVAGLCGGLIGYAFVDMQTDGDSAVWAGIGGLVGAVIFAVGVGIVAVLAMRAMGEWRVIEHTREQTERRGPIS